MLPEPRIGYVLKMYPRFSETFILTEILSMEQAGHDLEIFSLRPPADGRFHARLADVTAPVTYIRHSGLKAADVWESLRLAGSELGDISAHLDELTAVDVRDAFQALEIAVMVHQREITHLHAHFASVSTTVARLAARLSGITYSVTAHAKDIFHEEVDHHDLRRKLADASDVVTVSQFNYDYLHSSFGADAAGVRRVYNGLDLRDFPFSEPRERQPVIAAVGRLVEKKGFSDLLRAAVLLRDEGRTFRIDLVGTGLLAEQLSAEVDALGLAAIVRMHGALPQSRVRDIVSDAAVLAAPCLVAEDGNRDGLPTVLLEAMALGTPCVATPVTGIPEVITHEETGLLVPERDPRALARAIARLLDEADLRTALAKSARDLIDIDFDARRQAAAVARGFSMEGTN